MGQSEGTGQLVRDLWASGRTSQFFLREVGTTDASEQRGRSPDSGAHRRPLEAMGGGTGWGARTRSGPMRPHGSR